MVEYFNGRANISGNFPLGSFNAAFSFTGSKHVDAAATKTLSTEGFYIPLAKVQLKKSHLTLQVNVKKAVPVNWDPPALARYGYNKLSTYIMLYQRYLRLFLTFNYILTVLSKILGLMSLHL